MNTSDFDFQLPIELIAQQPAVPRESARLMVVDRKKKTIQHLHVSDLPQFFSADDLIVRNNSKVFKARLHGTLIDQNDAPLLDHEKTVEVFLVRPMENEGVWKALARPGRHVLPGTRVRFAHDFWCDVVIREKDGTVLVQFEDDGETVRKKANKYGAVPLPPYVKSDNIDLSQYQTAYAKDEKEGSVAAPTAGFHLTPAILQQIEDKGASFSEVTLHVGLGTFLPVKTEKIEEHQMHSEWVEIPPETADAINTAEQAGKRLVAVGTTTVRTLEGIAHLAGYHDHVLDPFVGDINIFITPGFEFQLVDALLTNFHLPKSTLLMLVSAFIGDTEFTLECYRQAVEEKYRFFSFGDAMLIV